MEIIHRGKDPRELTLEGKCEACGTVVSAKPYELHDATERPGEAACLMTDCPVCQRKIYFHPQ